MGLPRSKATASELHACCWDEEREQIQTSREPDEIAVGDREKTGSRSLELQ